MNIREFAKICGYSTFTVANAFSHPERVKETTREHVLKLAEKHGYRPNRASAAAFNGKTRSIGVMLIDGTISYFVDIESGIHKGLLERGYLPITLKMHWQDGLNVLRILIDHRVDGIIMVDPRRALTKEEQNEFKTIDIPYMFIDGIPSDARHDWVTTDDETGGRLAAEHLVALGHKNVVVYKALKYFSERRQGFEDYMKKSCVKCETIDGEKSLYEKLKDKKTRPTAIFAESDITAIECYAVAQELQLKIPQDISVIGYADLNFASMLNPPLTTVRQNGLELGMRTAEIMLERLKDREKTVTHEFMPVSLIERASTAPPVNPMNEEKKI